MFQRFDQPEKTVTPSEAQKSESSTKNQRRLIMKVNGDRFLLVKLLPPLISIDHEGRTSSSNAS